MKTKSIILTIILGIFYPFSLILRVKKNRITFISLEHDNLSKDFKLIYDRLKKKINMNCGQFCSNLNHHFGEI